MAADRARAAFRSARMNILRQSGLIAALLIGAQPIGCGPPRLPSEGGILAGAKFDIPVYPGARLVSKKSLMYQSDEHQNAVHSYDAINWELAVSDPVDKVVAFYDLRLPGSRQPDAPRKDSDPFNEDDEAAAEFRFHPPEAGDGDSVSISISEGSIEITQITRRD